MESPLRHPAVAPSREDPAVIVPQAKRFTQILNVADVRGGPI